MGRETKTPIVILHGWGVTGSKYHAIVTALVEQGYSVYAPDLPGFGNNRLEKEALTFDDYVDFVYQFIKALHVPKVILLGHSFGGRIAIRLTREHPELIEKLILTGASGVLHPLSLRKRLVSAFAKALKKIPGSSYVRQVPFGTWLRSDSSPFRFLLYRLAGDMDYYKSGNLKETFINVHRVSIEQDLPHIRVPTLLVWGREDRMIPLRDGELMHSQIPHSQLVIVDNASHKLPYEYPAEFIKSIEPFL